jgi:hypothetical protein
MASTVITPTYGVITLDGVQYIERPQIFALELPITVPFQVYTNQRLTMPGVADFLLKGLTRDTLVPGPPNVGDDQSQDRTFRFRLNNAEGSTWFFSGGLGIFDDRVVDTLCFGLAQFPYPVIPPIPVHANGTLLFEVEDIGVFGKPMDPDYYPYTIYFGFHGSYLTPVNPAQKKQT